MTTPISLLTYDDDSALQSSAITPGRKTVTEFDLDETVMSEPGMVVVRRGADVARLSVEKTADPSNYAGLKFFPSTGCWCLAPIQQDLTNITQYAEGQIQILDPSHFTLIQYLVATGIQATVYSTIPKFAQATALTGMGYSTNIAATGDPFMQATWGGGVNLDPTAVSGNAALTSVMPKAPLPDADIPVDRHGVSADSYPADQGWFLRWVAPGNQAAHDRYVWAFGFGQYWVVVLGDGKAELWEICREANGDAVWRRRDGWTYAQKAQVYNREHTLSIFPHVSPRGDKFIAFGNNQLDVAAVVSAFDRADSRHVANDDHVYRFSEGIRGDDQDMSPGHATKAGPVGFDVTRGLRLQLQISKLAFQTAGVLIDSPANVGGGSVTGNTGAVSVDPDKIVPTGCAITAAVYDAATRSAFVPGTSTQPYVQFGFSGDGTKTPVLFGYTMRQDPKTEAISPGAFSTTGLPDSGDPDRTTEYSMTGYSGDPSQVSASLTVKDVLNGYPRLRDRGWGSCRISVTDPVAGVVRMHRGQWVRPRSTRRGVPVGGYPADDWREFDIAVAPIWAKLARRVSGPVMMAYAQDTTATPDAVTGALPPWKVTDVIRDLLKLAGFPSSMVSIPDLPYRLWPGQTGKVDDYTVNPGTDYGEAIVRMVRNYLGCYFDFNENSGADGQWTLLFPSVPGDDGTFTPVFSFTTVPSATGMPHTLASYPPLTAPIFGHPDYVTIPPEFNMVMVSTDTALTTTNTRIQNVAYAYNPVSFHAPGSTVTPDPSHPDYMGECFPLIVLDPSLGGQTAADTWKAVSWTCRRLYDFLCHAQRLMHFRAPLVFVNDEALGSYRPLRFQDPVSIDGDSGWLVKSVRASYSLDRHQMADYEVIRPFAGQYFVGMDGLEYERQSYRKAMIQSVGHNTQTNLHGLHGVPPHREHSHMALPVYTPTQSVLQASDGSFHPMAGWVASSGASG